MNAEAASPTTSSYAALSTAEQLLVWGLRAWVACTRYGLDPEACLREGFDRSGVAEAASSLDALLQVTARTAQRSIDVRCVRCPSLSPDEALLLAVVAALQGCDRPAAEAALRGWMTPQAAGFAMGAAQGLATLLDLAGWALPRRRKGHDALEEWAELEEPAARPTRVLH